MNFEFDAAALRRRRSAMPPFHKRSFRTLEKTHRFTARFEGTVEPGPASNKWYNSKAVLGCQTAQVSQADGSFAFTNVLIQNGGSNELQVTVRDVSGNTATQKVWYIRDAAETFRYDANGNMTGWKKADGTEMEYVYDIFDRLYQVSRNGELVLQNSFDPFGRRIAKTEVISGATNREYYVYEGMSVIAVLDDAGRIKESFMRGPGIAGDVGSLIAATDHTGLFNATVYLHSDHRGNVVAARSFTTTVGTWSYDAWGVLTATNGTYTSRFLFSSKELDRSTGLYHYGFRDYSPELKRWISADPLGEAGGLNLYTFCANDPLSYVDPSGRNPLLIIALIGVFFGAEYAIAPGNGYDTSNPEYAAGQGVANLITTVAFAGGGTAARGFKCSAAKGEVPQVLKNRAAGNAFRDEVAQGMRMEGRDVATEVYKRTPFGKRYIDIEISLDGKVLGGIETKFGGSRYLPLQRVKDAWLQLVDGYPVNVIRSR
jgi:RHS repeat-associated protein